MHWSSARIYELQGRVIVAEGDTLVIEPGTIIKGGYGQGANSSVIVAHGYIEAKGTESNPIIMTSIADNIELGQHSEVILMKPMQDFGVV